MISVWPLPGIPEIEQGHDLTGTILAGCRRAGLEVADGDIFVVTHKIVSKAEG
ncbi:MAG: hypothetical protein HKN80_15080, partial [Acidimicrobiia bacterium]|nr:hypothetical protein [Acidimicrobiia bacterium]